MKNKKIAYIDVVEDSMQYGDFFISLYFTARGGGKTYSVLKWCIKNNLTFMLVRNIQVQIDTIAMATNNPFTVMNQKENINIQIEKTKEVVFFKDYDDENHRIVGYAQALSTVGNIRGTSFEDVDVIVYDEVTESKDKQKKSEVFMDFCNLIETCTRNNEVEGNKKIKIFCLSNSNTLNHSMFRALRVAQIIYDMSLKGSDSYIDKKKSMLVRVLELPDTLKKARAETQLYKWAEGTEFYDMALENKFINDYYGDLKALSPKEIRPLFRFANLYFYKWKKNDYIYISEQKMTMAENYESHEFKRFKQDYGVLLRNYDVNGMILYQNLDVKLDFEAFYFDNKTKL